MTLKIVLKGSSTSGWYAPPKGTHTGSKHRAAGSGTAAKTTAAMGKPATARELKGWFGQDNVRKGIPAAVKKQLRMRNAGEIAKEKDVFTIADGYFYRTGRTTAKHEAKVLRELDEAGYVATVLESGDHYFHGFKGGASLMSSKSSFFYTVARIRKKG